MCLPQVKDSDPRILSALEQAKMKVAAAASNTSQTGVVDKSNDSINESLNMSRNQMNVDSKTSPLKIAYNAKYVLSFDCENQASNIFFLGLGDSMESNPNLLGSESCTLSAST